MATHKHTNSLIHETSPYLLQHAHNPVQWFAWSEEALQRAIDEDKPILLSIGYSACHWCHVMEHESFENEAIAALMNEFFINIKVDREERPDLDAVYMRAVQMLTGRGGWPMTVFLTPGLQPFYCGTYFPPEDRHGMPGFPRVLRSVSTAWRGRKAEIMRDASAIVAEMNKGDLLPDVQQELRGEILDQAVSRMMAAFDHSSGGFGDAPKFPPAMSLDFLMRRSVRGGNGRLREAVEQTLTAMAQGGLYDQLGGGFHRYSVDARWRVPHFEKMLYDNALLSRAYLHAFLLTGRPYYRRIAQETLDYVLRELTAPEGGFYSTQDADSEGEEGRYYTWEPDEVGELLGAEEAGLICAHYGIDGAGELDGKHVLRIALPESELAGRLGISEGEALRRTEGARRALLAARERRVHPARDEKILVSWNGLMMKSFAEASQALDRDDYRVAAARCGAFLLDRLAPAGTLLHCYMGGQARIEAFLDDYACLADGLLSLYEATFEPRWFKEAARIASAMIERFRAPEGIGFFLTSGSEVIIHRPREYYDNATPSGNSAAAHALLRLSRFTGDEGWVGAILPLFRSLAPLMARHPSAFANMLAAVDDYLSGGLEIGIIADPGGSAAKPMVGEVFSRYLPHKVVACGRSGDVYLLEHREQISGRPTAYVCRQNTCMAPVTAAGDLARLLDIEAGPRVGTGPVV